MPNVLSPRDLDSRSDIMDETVPHAADIEMMFCLNLCIYIDNSLVVFWKRFLLLPRFSVENAKNNIFLNINGF